MTDMIDREKVIKGLECCMINPDFCDRTNCPYAGKGDENDYCDVKLIKDTIALLKAQEPVAHGRWIDQCGDMECSECHTIIDSEALWYYRHSNYQPRDDDFEYCPSCGAKMDGGTEL